MTLAQLVPLVIQASIVLLVFSFALPSPARDALSLLRRPAQLARAVISLYVVMPALAVALALTFDLHPEIKLALAALALSPVPPFLPGKAHKADGEASYTIGLLATSSLLAIVVVPLWHALLGPRWGVQTVVSTFDLAKIVLITVLAPLAAGFVVHAMAPGFAKKLVRPVSILANVLLAASVLVILAGAWHGMLSLIGQGTLVAIVFFVTIGLVAGHLLGGPIPEDRPVLALATSARHPAFAIAIAHAAFPDMKLAAAAVLLYLIVSAIATVPYMNWIKRRGAGVVAGA